MLVSMSNPYSTTTQDLRNLVLLAVCELRSHPVKCTRGKGNERRRNDTALDCECKRLRYEDVCILRRHGTDAHYDVRARRHVAVTTL